jgi:hypothetical protein
VIGGGAADDAAADHHDLGMAGQGPGHDGLRSKAAMRRSKRPTNSSPWAI